MRIIFNWFIRALAIAISAYLLPGVGVDNLMTALILAVVLAAINTFIKPVIIFFTLPLTILTLGLFTLVINALLIMLAGAFVPGFDVDGFVAAFLFAIVLSIVSAVLQMFSKRDKEEKEPANS